MLFEPSVRFHSFRLVRVAAHWEVAAHSAYDMFCKYKYLIVNLVFPASVFEVGISF